MHDNVLTSLNWLDLLMILIVISAIFRGAVRGFVVESFKVLGIFFATVLSLHFYVRAADYFKHFIALPFDFGQIVSFVLIAALIILVFRLVCQGWLLVLKVEAKAGFSQWGGALLAIFHGFMISGLLFFGIFLFGNKTLMKFANHSVTGFYLLDLSPTVYKATYDGLIVRFFPDEEFNKKALETTQKKSAAK